MIDTNHNEETVEFPPDEMDMLELERTRLRAAGLYGEDDPFFRELLGDDVCDYSND